MLTAVSALFVATLLGFGGAAFYTLERDSRT